MAIRLDRAILRGEISNEIRGLVTGLVWVFGRDKPIVLRLKGNCLRDLAGCSITFENPHPEVEELTEILFDEQEGLVGDMTASRRAKVPTVTQVELQKLLRQKKPVPSVTVNTLYLEWFSERNGRVVIETSNCIVKVSEPIWIMTAQEERAQETESQQNFYAFLDKITGCNQPEEFSFGIEEDESDRDDSFLFMEPTNGLLGGDEEVADEDADLDDPSSFDEDLEPLDEFEWERELREADRKAAAYQEALEKYKDAPDRDKLVAGAMGWDEADDLDVDFDWEEMEFNIDPDLTGNDPESESEPDLDELRHHPLSKRVTNLALHLQRDAEVRGLLAKHDPAAGCGNGQIANNPYLSVVMHIIALGGKLAAALDGPSQGIDPEPGFVIAMLKRAQIPLNEALHAMGSLFTDHLDENTAEWLEFARSELFDLRNDILEIMRELRTKPNK
ncbi:MAG: hypothetical protein R3F19_15750 [Verrucomicrobiales bacterium]